MPKTLLTKKIADWKPVKYFKEFYCLSSANSYRLVNEPDFPKIKIGNVIRVNMAEVEEYLNKKFN